MYFLIGIISIAIIVTLITLLVAEYKAKNNNKKYIANKQKVDVIGKIVDDEMDDVVISDETDTKVDDVRNSASDSYDSSVSSIVDEVVEDVVPSSLSESDEVVAASSS